MPRYRIGDRIKILPESATLFAGFEAIIQEIRPHKRGITELDSYIVLFQGGERHMFYDVQLARVDGS